VTGGAGFIGHHAVWRALERGWQVTVLDNFYTGKLENITLPSGNIPGGLRVYECDIAGGPLPDIENIDYLLHLAAPVSVQESLEDWEKYWRGIVEGSRRIFKWAHERGCQSIVAASTAAVYGNSEEWPFKETTTPDPMSPYAEYKLDMEGLLEEFHKTNTQAAALRFFNVFGEGQPDDVGYVSAIPIFKKQFESYQPITVTGDGKQTRDFVYVGDVVEACFAALTRPDGGFEAMPIWNVASGEETSILDIAEQFGGEIVHIDPRDEPKRSVADISLITQMLDWRPSMSVLQWIKEQRDA
ncbi:MAG: NAD-dependent epimerase/dehydratase family protein, partial [Rhodobacterales bacterium]|nr:NAD-dependent epimerase/dehydratase family protein [Rhodobacterales bacterium]